MGLQNLTLGVQLQPQNNTKCRPWAFKALALKALCSRIFSGGSLLAEKGIRAMSVGLSKHFHFWSPNGWSDRDGRIFFDAPERQKDDGAICGHVQSRANTCQKSLARAACLTSGRIGLRLCGPIATKGGHVQLGVRTVAPGLHV